MLLDTLLPMELRLALDERPPLELLRDTLEPRTQNQQSMAWALATMSVAWTRRSWLLIRFLHLLVSLAHLAAGTHLLCSKVLVVFLLVPLEYKHWLPLALASPWCS